MPEVSNIGATDYTQQYPQYADTQVPDSYESYPEYSGAERQNSSGIGLLTASLISLGIGTAAFFAGKKMGAKAGKNAAELAEAQLNDIKNSEAVKNYDGLKKAAEDIVKDINDKKDSNWKIIRWFKNKFHNKISGDKVKEKFKPFIDTEVKSEKTAKDSASKTKKTDKKD